jgi:hypothetical protein
MRVDSSYKHLPGWSLLVCTLKQQRARLLLRLPSFVFVHHTFFDCLKKAMLFAFCCRKIPQHASGGEEETLPKQQILYPGGGEKLAAAG